ncbi:MAG: hypothetical protein K0Q57_21 [Gammaproteobacteria bacterium]|jgi:hypothetical protein|nr:hypothetical protein [Gammaproteobacteria bacterium]
MDIIERYKQKALKYIMAALSVLPRHVPDLLLKKAIECARNRPNAYPNFLKDRKLRTFYEENPYIGLTVEANQYRPPVNKEYDLTPAAKAKEGKLTESQYGIIEVSQRPHSSIDLGGPLPTIDEFNLQMAKQLEEIEALFAHESKSGPSSQPVHN